MMLPRRTMTFSENFRVRRPLLLLFHVPHILAEYRLTWILDTLRRTDFTRLKSTGETYVDYMGGAIYPESLIRVHTDFLHRSVLGNTHSVSNRSVPALDCLLRCLIYYLQLQTIPKLCRRSQGSGSFILSSAFRIYCRVYNERYWRPETRRRVFPILRRQYLRFVGRFPQ